MNAIISLTTGFPKLLCCIINGESFALKRGFNVPNNLLVSRCGVLPSRGGQFSQDIFHWVISFLYVLLNQAALG